MSRSTETTDILVIGAGIVGMATALELQQRHPKLAIKVVDKEADVAQHQTGHNSGVIHAGVYYHSGSLKARFCREGKQATEAFCEEHALPYKRCGKLIVATDEHEWSRMQNLHQRSVENEVEISQISEQTLRELEPNIQGVGALVSPSTGITDYGVITAKMTALFVGRGGDLEFGVTVVGGEERENDITINTQHSTVAAGKVISCAGLMSDRLAKMFGATPDYQIIPFRGEYFRIKNQPDNLVSHLIYPVPDPERPFLGVHLTRKLDGGFTVGPNAVLATKREGYKMTDFSFKDMTETLTFPGFWRVIANNFSSAIDEFSASAMRSLYLKKVHKYCPTIKAEDLSYYPAGVRAQAVSRQGKIIDDFLFLQTKHSIHVCNAPSPAATASMPIAKHIVDQLDA